MSALWSFLGGSVFRMMWGEVSAYFTARQNHKFEIERMQAQELLDAKAHERQQEAIRTQAELGIKTIQVAADAEMAKVDASAFAEAVAAVGRATGIKWLDAWNGSIRPLLATVSFAVVVVEVARHGFELSEWDRELVGAILGIYVADRTLAHRGK